MIRETKIGLMMLTLLVGVIGFLGYKQYYRPSEALSEQSGPETATTDLNNAIPRANDDDAMSFGRPQKAKKDRAANSQRDRDDFAAFDTSGSDGLSIEANPKRKKNKSADAVAADDSEFRQFRERKSDRASASAVATIEPADGAFDDFSSEKSSVDKNPAWKRNSSRAIVQTSGTADSDPFAGDNAAAEFKSDEPAERDSTRRTRPLSVPGELDQQPAPIGVPSSVPEPDDQSDPFASPRRLDTETTTSGSYDQTWRRDFRPRDSSDVRQTSEFESNPEPAPRPVRRAAPAALVDGDLATADSSFRSGNVDSGDSYVIQPNDNFWTISRKQYGSGRYFMALLRHNEQVIPDPKRMKPGITIMTPAVDVLERRYADLISKPASSDTITPVSSLQSRPKEDSAPAGYFMGEDGAPMYRVGDRDTLSEIAKSHLGRSSRWVQILEMNRNVLRDGNELRIGTVLRLPADASQVQIMGTHRERR